jgi:hypothetical protein
MPKAPLLIRVTRVLYALFWLSIALAIFIPGLGPPRQPTAEANAFWDALVATGFMVPMLWMTYMLGGIFCLADRTAPLGLAVLSAPMAIIVPFDALLARQAGPWIAVVLVHVGLLYVYRAAYVPLWTFGTRRASA